MHERPSDHRRIGTQLQDLLGRTYWNRIGTQLLNLINQNQLTKQIDCRKATLNTWAILWLYYDYLKCFQTFKEVANPQFVLKKKNKKDEQKPTLGS